MMNVLKRTKNIVSLEIIQVKQLIEMVKIIKTAFETGTVPVYFTQNVYQYVKALNQLVNQLLRIFPGAVGWQYRIDYFCGHV